MKKSEINYLMVFLFLLDLKLISIVGAVKNQFFAKIVNFKDFS